MVLGLHCVLLRGTQWLATTPYLDLMAARVMNVVVDTVVTHTRGWFQFSYAARDPSNWTPGVNNPWTGMANAIPCSPGTSPQRAYLAGMPSSMPPPGVLHDVWNNQVLFIALATSGVPPTGSLTLGPPPIWPQTPVISPLPDPIFSFHHCSQWCFASGDTSCIHSGSHSSDSSSYQQHYYFSFFSQESPWALVATLVASVSYVLVFPCQCLALSTISC